MKKNNNDPKNSIHADQLFDEMVTLLKSHKSPPTLKEYLSISKYSKSLIIKRFGSWRYVLYLLGFNEDHQITKKISKTDCKKYLYEFYEKNGRIPQRREYDAINLAPSTSIIRKLFGSYNRFIKLSGFTPNDESYGKIWRPWEKLVFEIIKDIYPNFEVLKQFSPKKSKRIIDYYIPKLKLGIDAKTSNYNIKARDTQAIDFVNSPDFETVEFWCLEKMNHNSEYVSINYIYASQLLEKINSIKLKKRLIKFINKENSIRSELGLITKEELIESIKIKSYELGRTPKMKEVTKDIRFYSYKPYIDVFGSWNKALEASGFSPKKQFVSKLTYDEVVMQFKKSISGYKKLHGNYPSNRQYLEYTYKNDVISWKIVRHKTQMTYNCLLRELGIAVPKKTHYRKQNISDVEQFLINKNIELVDRSYINSKTKLKLKCKFHKVIFNISFEKLKKTKFPCPKCYREYMSRHFKSDLQEVQKRANARGLDLEENQVYELARTPMKFKCIGCGKKIIKSFNNLSKFKGCKDCIISRG